MLLYMLVFTNKYNRIMYNCIIWEICLIHFNLFLNTASFPLPLFKYTRGTLYLIFLCLWVVISHLLLLHITTQHIFNCSFCYSPFVYYKGVQPRSTYLFLGNVALSDLLSGIAVVFGQFYPKEHRDEQFCAIQMGMFAAATTTISMK